MLKLAHKFSGRTTFFSLFGDDFKKRVEFEIKASKNLEAAVKAFLEIGHLRNILVHSNFSAYDIDNKTTDEIFRLYETGLPFIEYIENILRSDLVIDSVKVFPSN